MLKKICRLFSICITLVVLYCPAVLGQPTVEDLKKPKKFENRKLGSEKTDEKKFKLPRKFIQNSVTHYNFYYNAETKLDEILVRSKAEHKDNFKQFLPFYNYTLESTAKFKSDLDSVISKSTAGILLHDLRNSWVDNLYMLIGRAYFYRNKLDSAYITFQYVNYAFSPKEKDGYDKVIGSNSNEGGSAFAVSTNEKRNFVKKTFSLPPSRNESLIWQVRTYLANNDLPSAGALIETLKNDPLFPERLKTDLEEVRAYWYYKNKVYDSAAFHLEKALDNAESKLELSRWEYLIAQMYERTKNTELAKKYYEESIKHTMDPILEVYARLNSIRQTPGEKEDAEQQAIDEFIKMAKKDKYITYRDVIYYTAAQIELERNNPEAAKTLLQKSIRYSMNNPEQKNSSFLAMANISYDLRDYREANRFYDSVSVNMIDSVDLLTYKERKTALSKIAFHKGIIERQDSLQRIAAMDPKDREVLIKKMVKQMRKQQGLKDEGGGNDVIFFAKNNNMKTPDMFDVSAQGDFYFYNANLKARGFTEFKSKWGSRPNVDNWQRLSAINNLTYNKVAEGPGNLTRAGLAAADITVDGLTDNLPLTPEKLKLSNDSVDNALFNMGVVIQNNLEEYAAAIAIYDSLLAKFPETTHREETLFNLYYCYKKIGNEAKMAETKQLMQSKYASGKYLSLLDKKSSAELPDVIRKTAVTNQYDDIYNLFIEGKFDEALAKKKSADSLYGETYWNPQLLYIEAVYYVRQREDSVAKITLQKIMQKYPSTPIYKKSETLLSVLNRRKEIEEYLTNLQIERPAEDSIVIVNDIDTVRRQPRLVRNDSNLLVRDSLITQKTPVKKIDAPGVQKIDSSKFIKAPTNTAFTYTPDQKQFVGLVLDQVDPVYANEAKNAFNRYHREKYYNKTFEIVTVPVSDSIKIILFKDFENAQAALDYIEKTRKAAPVEIIPWLTEKKYSFVPITQKNLDILVGNKDLPAYKKFLHALYPDKY